MLSGFICVFVKVDQNKIDNVIADKDLHCRITEEYIHYGQQLKNNLWEIVRRHKTIQVLEGHPFYICK